MIFALTGLQRFDRANVKSELCFRPTENDFAKLTSLRFSGYFSNNDVRLVARLTAVKHNAES